jgi:hypothetical protein
LNWAFSFAVSQGRHHPIAVRASPHFEHLLSLLDLSLLLRDGEPDFEKELGGTTIPASFAMFGQIIKIIEIRHFVFYKQLNI